MAEVIWQVNITANKMEMLVSGSFRGVLSVADRRYIWKVCLELDTTWLLWRKVWWEKNRKKHQQVFRRMTVKVSKIR